MARKVASSSLKRLLTTTTPHLAPPPPTPLFVKSYRDHRLQDEISRRLTRSPPSRSRYNMESINGFWAPPQEDDCLPGMDYKHWFISVVPSVSENLSKEQLINCYIRTLAKVLGSVEEANEKIYKVTLHPSYPLGFGCEVNWEIASKLENLPEVGSVISDSYDDPEHKDYGGLLFVKGKIVERGDRSKISGVKLCKGEIVDKSPE